MRWQPATSKAGNWARGGPIVMDQRLTPSSARSSRPRKPSGRSRSEPLGISGIPVGRLAAASVRVCSYCRPLVLRSIEASGRASDVALDRLPTGTTAHGHLDRVGLIPLVDMRGNSGGTTDANASAKQAAPCAITVQAFQVGERWRHGFTITAVAL